ncbi:MAG: hypothetical protein ACJAUV_001461 [Flavobacteriales bacterium]|jgi:hypothetical protein
MKRSYLNVMFIASLLVSCQSPTNDTDVDKEKDTEIATVYSDAQQMITIASIAYDSTLTELKAKLADKNLSTQGNWELVWGPEDINTTKIFVVKNKNALKPTYAVSIQGTTDSLLSWLYDFDDFKLVPLPWSANNQKQIGIGLRDAWRNISLMQSSNVNLLTFLKNTPVGTQVYVTGHSLGGALATIVAAWLHDTLPGKIIKPITFAGQTAGNSLFARNYNVRFKSNTPEALDKRYFNTLDIVPMGFSNIAEIKKLYQSPGPACPFATKVLIDGFELALNISGDEYIQVGTPYLLPSRVIPASTFFKEIGFQHSHFTYQYLMKVPFTDKLPQPYPPKHL